jgi:hypothetical protein
VALEVRPCPSFWENLGKNGLDTPSIGVDLGISTLNWDIGKETYVRKKSAKCCSRLLHHVYYLYIIRHEAPS